jgi:hypothetical protein
VVKTEHEDKGLIGNNSDFDDQEETDIWKDARALGKSKMEVKLPPGQDPRLSYKKVEEFKGSTPADKAEEEQDERVQSLLGGGTPTYTPKVKQTDDHGEWKVTSQRSNNSKKSGKGKKR